MGTNRRPKAPVAPATKILIARLLSVGSTPGDEIPLAPVTAPDACHGGGWRFVSEDEHGSHGHRVHRVARGASAAAVLDRVPDDRVGGRGRGRRAGGLPPLPPGHTRGNRGREPEGIPVVGWPCGPVGESKRASRDSKHRSANATRWPGGSSRPWRRATSKG